MAAQLPISLGTNYKLTHSILNPSPTTTTTFSCKLNPAKFQSSYVSSRRQVIAKAETSLTDLDLEPSVSDLPVQHAQLPDEDLASRWREIHGSTDWQGLLDPMDPLLRKELIRYGEFTQATYDAFDYDPFSKYCGSCKYPKKTFFADLDLDAAGYEVTQYIYATTNIKLPNFGPQSQRKRTWTERASWVGYVAVSGDEATKRLGRRDIVVAWRGTITKLEWLVDLTDFLLPVAQKGIPCKDVSVKAEAGFIDYYTDIDSTCRFCKYSAKEQVHMEVKRLMDLYTKAGEEVSITVTGHSLGSALAMLCAYDIAESGINIKPDGERANTCVMSFAGPRVGNVHFKERFEGLGIKALRVLNVHDTVPKVPGIFLNESGPAFLEKFIEEMPGSYCHAGVELALDHKHSPFLKDTVDVAAFHNLEALMHLIDGYHGRGMPFNPATGRDPALVNKTSDFLKEDLMIPPNWRQDENKNMIRTSEGRWVLAQRPELDDNA